MSLGKEGWGWRERRVRYERPSASAQERARNDSLGRLWQVARNELYVVEEETDPDHCEHNVYPGSKTGRLLPGKLEGGERPGLARPYENT